MLSQLLVRFLLGAGSFEHLPVKPVGTTPTSNYQGPGHLKSQPLSSHTNEHTSRKQGATPTPCRLEFHFAPAPSTELCGVWALKPFVGKGYTVQMTEFPIRRFFFPHSVRRVSLLQSAASSIQVIAQRMYCSATYTQEDF